MNVSLYQAASALNANSRWQEIIADNLASGSVPGYKKQELSMAAVQAGLMPGGEPGMGNAPQMFVVPRATTSTNFSNGELKFTGVNTDVAIQGGAFFNVQLPTGAVGYTRDGEFQIDTTGKLVTKEGYPVLSQIGQGQAGQGQGAPIQLDPHDPSPLSIAAGGEISQGSATKGKLALTEFGKPALLTQINGGYFVAQNPKLQTQPTTSTVRQAYVEGSNSSTVGEMANLLTAMRGFEANQHVIQIQDDRLGKTIADLGNPT